MSWILKMSLCLISCLSLISLGMVILPCTPTLMVYSAMCVVGQCIYMVFFYGDLMRKTKSFHWGFIMAPIEGYLLP